MWRLSLLLLSGCVIFAEEQVKLSTYDEVAITVSVKPGTIECFYQPITDPKYRYVEFSYQVISGGDLDINVYIQAEDATQPLIKDERKSEATHRIDVKAAGNKYGDYAICLDNSFSIRSSKLVYMETYLLLDDGSYGNVMKFQDVAHTMNQFTNFDKITQDIKNKLNKVEQEQQHHRVMESRDREQMENNFETVNFYSVFATIIMVLTSTIQVYIIRALFNEGGPIAKLFRFLDR
uniref:GOLD domain-containing protein n=1 Tax=Rhabditophanes sp. KR3021 TaxID=114890 RepID=A0AC35U6S3_9BILA